MEWLSTKRRTIGKVVAAVLAIGGVISIPQDVENWANGLQRLFSGIGDHLFGTVLLVLAFGILLLTYWPQIKHIIAGGAREQAAFEWWMLSSEISSIMLRGLLNDEPSLFFNIIITSRTPWPFVITGVAGSVSIAGQPCNSPATLSGQPINVRSATERWNCVIHLPISDKLRDRIQSLLAAEGGIVQVNLTGLNFVGTAKMQHGDAPLRYCQVLRHGFSIRGPIRIGADDIDQMNNLGQIAEPIFFSQLQYDNHLNRKPNA